MEQKQKHSSKLLLFWLFSLLGQYKRLTLTVSILFISVLTLELTLPKLLGSLIDRIESLKSVNDRMILWGALFYLGLSLIKGLFEFGRGVLNTKLNQQIIAGLRVSLYEHITNMSFSFHDRQNAGQLITRGSRDVEKIAAFYTQVLLVGGEALLLMIGTALVLTYIQPLLSLVAFLGVLPSFIAIIVYANKLRPLWRRVDDLYDSVTSVVQENVSGIRVVKAFNAQDREKGRFKGSLTDFVNDLLKAVDYWTKAIMLPGNMFSVSIPLIFVTGTYLVMHDKMTIGSITTGVLYLSNISRRMRIVEHIVDVLQTSLASADRLYEVFKTEPEIKNSSEPVALPQNPSLCIRGVDFCYGEDKPVLSSIDLEIKHGETIAFFGRTGSGKSTLISLLPRFYEPRAGSIELSGLDIKDVDLKELRRKIVVVFQEAFLFNASIADNIRFGRLDASLDEVKEAARSASIDDFIDSLEDGYDTIIGERGVSLSGGQKQRIALARAFIMQPEILILDDTTSSVDSITEAKIRDAMYKIAKGRTTIIISQRITSVQYADRIVVLDRGDGEGAKIAAMGTHEELIGIPGIYRDIYNEQTYSSSEIKEA